MQPQIRHRSALFVAFTLSGCSGLLYETLWTHYLKLFLGHAAYAQTLVLAMFMGGMALGASVCSRWSPKWSNPLRGYAIAEAAIGLVAVVFHPIFLTAIDAAFRIVPTLPSPEAVTAFKWVLGGALILPQSVLLGMTFPLMAGGFIRAFPDTPGRSLATLYFCNSMGGVVGVLLGGFVLIPGLGLPVTGTAAGVLNLMVAALVWSAARAATAPQPTPGSTVNTLPERLFDVPYRLLLATSLLTGTASFVYEVGWIRMLSLVLGSSSHAFELMLSAFILGLACGGWWIRGRIDAITEPVRYLGCVQVGMGLMAMATLPVYPWTFLLSRTLIMQLPKTDTGYLLFHLGSHAMALVVMLPATFLAGTTLPLITAMLVRAGHGEKSIGAVYGANTVGAIVGVALAVHVGLPLLGLKVALVAGAALDMGIGLMLLARAGGRRLTMPWAPAGLATAAVAGVLLFVHFDTGLMASGVFRESQGFIRRSEDVLFHKDGKTATVSVTMEHGIKGIRTNGKVDATVQTVPGAEVPLDEPTQTLAAALPLLLKPDARRAANIGFGSGVTTHVLLSSPALSSVDTIEIEAAMVEGASRFRPRNERAFSDPRSHIVIDDAKTFFASERRPYDVIVSEPSNPWVSGTASLFTSEFYRLVHRHLAPGGVFMQWLQLYEFDVPLAASVLKALGGEFEDYAIFAVSKGDLLIVAVNGPRLPDLPATYTPAPVAAELQRVGLRSLQDVLARRIANKRLLEPWLRSLSVRPNSDYRPVLDDGAARARFMNRNAFDLVTLGSGRVPVLAMLGRVSRRPVLAEMSAHTYFPDSPQPFVARELQQLLEHPQPALLPVAGEVRPTPKTPRQRAEALLHECATAPVGDAQRRALVALGMNLSAFLPEQDAMDAWSRAEQWACANGRDRATTEWLALFRAVGLRDPEAMSASAERVLAAHLATGTDVGYVVAAGMLGHLARGEAAEARTLWQTASPFDTSPELRLVLAVLAAHAQT